MALPSTSRNPASIQNGPYGPERPSVGTRRQAPPPFTLQRPPAQGVEQFGAEVADANVARALNQLQENIRQATSQAKTNPLADCNLLVNVTLVNGNDGGRDAMVLSHGLGRPLQGFQIQSSTRGGYVYRSALVPNDNPDEDASVFRLWVMAQPFDGFTSVTADILVY